LIIQQNPITIFSKSYCPYCTRAKSFLNDKLLNKQLINMKANQELIKVIELDLLPSNNSTQNEHFGNISGQDLQNELANKLGKSRVTVPQIFIDNQHIGGCDDLLAYEKRGELDSILAKITTTTTATS
ncbi:hypothetical protein CROQUDRAFT_41404, partial [Cronartium quercuum f. sp. fusiforme G11]